MSQGTSQVAIPRRSVPRTLRQKRRRTKGPEEDWTKLDEKDRPPPPPKKKKVRRMGSEWPSLDTLRGSPHEDLDNEKTTGAKSQSSKLPETPYVTPKKRQVASAQRRTQDP
ncbi:hypothetical protein HOLleu_43171 [Holothuria leucospilota]|uniref:Uncharacterized protein n=1 Tax=Holothuria leucospilota TaxID=206669 RepID=A0A9Q0YAY6_HOLLE|nr:hypothetical protein HOLleu_43171 [Holothuria leucospilota]